MNRPLSCILHSQYLFIPLTSKYALIKAVSVYAQISLVLYWILHQQMCHHHVWFRNVDIIIIIIIIIMDVSCHRHFFPVLLLNQQ